MTFVSKRTVQLTDRRSFEEFADGLVVIVQQEDSVDRDDGGHGRVPFPGDALHRMLRPSGT